jgi:hypothetical protein
MPQEPERRQPGKWESGGDIGRHRVGEHGPGRSAGSATGPRPEDHSKILSFHVTVKVPITRLG